MSIPQSTGPNSRLAGLRQHFKADALSGFLVFLIALPLCLAISKASGFPPVSGILTAIIGGLVVTFFGGSELTIKGPAAGLIVIAVGAVDELGRGDALRGYHLTLAVVVVAGIIQIIFGLLRTGLLSDFFPAAAVRGMMASIGITVIIKQLFVLVGVKPEAKETLRLIGEIPHVFTSYNPDILVIGVVSLTLLFGIPLISNTYIQKIPVPLAVLLVAIPLGRYFGLGHAHSYLFLNHHPYQLGPDFLVKLPGQLIDAITFPDFSQVFSGTSIKYIAMFALVGSLESLLSTKAIDMMDPSRRKSNMNRDLLGVGVGNTLAGLVGGLPMISEIVRSSANVNNGAQTRWANFFHGLFLLLFVAFAARLLSQIPLAALAAMLIYTGFRLAAPKEFVHIFRIGGEQLVIFLVTIFVSLGTDLLLGIGAGILTKLIIHLFRGLPLRSIFNASVEIEAAEDGSYQHVTVHDAAVFSNFISLKNRLEALPIGQHIVIDLSQTQLVDHTVLENLTRFQQDYAAAGGYAELVGLEGHTPVSAYPTAARVRTKEVITLTPSA
jgi:MFS superfamily sulfate permease-like transporter